MVCLYAFITSVVDVCVYVIRYRHWRMRGNRTRVSERITEYLQHSLLIRTCIHGPERYYGISLISSARMSSACLSLDNDFVRISAIISFGATFCRIMSWFFTASRTKLNWILTCFVRSLNFVAIVDCIAPWLSQYSSPSDNWGTTNSLISPRSYMDSFVASVSALYSASVDDNATDLCFLDFQLIPAPPKANAYPVYDIESIGSFPQSASAYPMIFFYWSTVN